MFGNLVRLAGGREQVRHAELFELVGNGINQAAVQLDVEHCNVGPRARLQHFQSVLDRGHGAHDARSFATEALAQVERNRILLLDDEDPPAVQHIFGSHQRTSRRLSESAR